MRKVPIGGSNSTGPKLAASDRRRHPAVGQIISVEAAALAGLSYRSISKRLADRALSGIAATLTAESRWPLPALCLPPSESLAISAPWIRRNPRRRDPLPGACFCVVKRGISDECIATFASARRQPLRRPPEMSRDEQVRRGARFETRVRAGAGMQAITSSWLHVSMTASLVPGRRRRRWSRDTDSRMEATRSLLRSGASGGLGR